MSVLEFDDDPFARLDALIETPEHARYAVNLFAGFRELSVYVSEHHTTAAELAAMGWGDPQLLEWVQDIREASQDRQRAAQAICAVDLWLTRTRLEWGLP